MFYLLTGILFLLAPQIGAAQVYCPPSGMNAYGYPCQPGQTQSLQGATEPQQRSQALTYPGQPQSAMPPSIINQPAPGLPPSFQLPGVQGGTPQTAPTQAPGMPQIPGLTDPASAKSGQRAPYDRGRMPMALSERNEFQDLVLQSIGHDLPMFGYNLFQYVPSTFAPVDRIPVIDANWIVVGTGDYNADYSSDFACIISARAPKK